MFRRRTDQVFATLQQVQRRITEQPGQPSQPPPPEPQRAAASAPLAQLQEAMRQPRPQLAPLQPEAPPPSFAPPKGGVLLSLSLQTAVTLIVLWIASCVLCFVLGGKSSERRGPAVDAGYAVGEAGGREAPKPDDAPTRALGEDLLVLSQVAGSSVTPELEQQYRLRASQLNDIMRKNGERGWKPWFGVRRPPSGELQLVFGEVAAGQYGVPKKDFDDFARMMAQPPPKGGNFGSAVWVKVK